jgi:hypothetical protein
LKWLGRLNLRGDRHGRNNRYACDRTVKICDVESITLCERIAPLADADGVRIADRFFGNRCGHPRREQPAKTCKAKRRDPNCSDHNPTPTLPTL